jgi:hypothetical protein
MAAAGAVAGRPSDYRKDCPKVLNRRDATPPELSAKVLTWRIASSRIGQRDFG